MGAHSQALLMSGNSGALWTPDDLSVGSEMWLDNESDMTGVAPDMGTWRDRRYDVSTYPNFASEGVDSPTQNATGLNGMRTLEFDGVNDSVDFGTDYQSLCANRTENWFAIVVKKTATDGAGTARSVIGWPTTDTTLARLRLDFGSVADANKPFIRVRRSDGDSAADLTASADVDANWHIWLVTMDWANGDGKIYLDGTLDVSDNALTSSGSTSNSAANSVAHLGSANNAINYTDMSVAEIIAGRSGLPSAGEIDKIFGYLAWKWGLEANLPGGHAYESAPPYA